VAATSVQTSPPAVPATSAVAGTETQDATEAVAPGTSASQLLVPAIVDPPATDSEPPATTVSATP
jgi:hypothetical protein